MVGESISLTWQQLLSMDSRLLLRLLVRDRRVEGTFKYDR